MNNWKIWLSPPQLSGLELTHLQQTLQQNWITTTGPQLTQFETLMTQYTNARYAQATNSGTAALHLALLGLGIGKGDYVICPSFTFAASAFPIVYVGATPIFIDSDPESWNMSPELLQNALVELANRGITPSAIIAVHIYGNPCDWVAIKLLAEQYSIPIVEDAAQSLGSTYKSKMTGTFGDLGMYSFNGNKILTTGGGGMLVTNNEALIYKTRSLANQSNSGTNYFLHQETGYNYRMSNVLASIGIAQMSVLKERIASKQAIFNKYKSGIQTQVEFQGEYPETVSNRWLTCLLFPNQQVRDSVYDKLTAHSIESRFLMKPMHQQPAFSTYPVYKNGVSDELFTRGLCVPSGTGLNDDELDLIIKLVNEVG